MRRREAEGRGHSQNSASEKKNTACGYAVHTRHLTETTMLALVFGLPYKHCRVTMLCKLPKS